MRSKVSRIVDFTRSKKCHGLISREGEERCHGLISREIRRCHAFYILYTTLIISRALSSSSEESSLFPVTWSILVVFILFVLVVLFVQSTRLL